MAHPQQTTLDSPARDTRSTKDTGAAREASALSRRDRRRLRKQLEQQSPHTSRPGWWSSLVSGIRKSRAAAMSRPGRTGWNRRGGGAVNWVEEPAELQGTAVQLCGYWPFITGSGLPVTGTPLGTHLTRGSVVYADPMSWFLAEIINNPSGFVLGQPGLGKTSLVKRMMTVLTDWGVIPMALSDSRPDYVELIRELGGQVIEFGPGRGHMNFMDLGPLVSALSGIEDENLRTKALEEMRGRRRSLMAGLVGMAAGRALQAHESSALATAMQMMDPELDNPPLLPQLIEFLQSRPKKIRSIILTHDDEQAYDERLKGLLDALISLGPDGIYGDLFSKPTTTHIEQGKPVVFDISGIDENDTVLMASVQSLCWSLGSATVSAEQSLAADAGRNRRNYLLIMDELWKVLRASDQMVYFIDSLTRLNRGRGMGQILITHTMKDLKLSNDALTSIAWGFVSRSEMVFLGGLDADEMGNLRDVFDLSRTEVEHLTDWADKSAGIGTNQRRPHTGKFILKTGKRPGIPFKVKLTSVEEPFTNSNKAWNMDTHDMGVQDTGAVA